MAKKQVFLGYGVKKILDVQFNQRLQYVTKGKKASKFAIIRVMQLSVTGPVLTYHP